MERVIVLVALARFVSTFDASGNSLTPKMFHLDPFDGCFEGDMKYSENVYCIADVYIKPNKSSEVWNLIESNSKPWRTHYRHDHLVHGVCLKRCKELLAKFDVMTQREFFSRKPEDLDSIEIDPFTFHHAIEDKFMYEETVNECINYEMRKKFNVEAFSEVQYCEVANRNDDNSGAIASFSVVAGIYAFLVVLSTLIDISVKNWKIIPSSHDLITTFSLTSNYKCFVKKPESSDLEFIHSIKFLTMLLVIWGHCIVLHSGFPFSNPEYIEAKYEETWVMLLLNGTMIIQSFFFMSGFLLAIQFSKRTSGTVKVLDLFVAVFLRLARLLPLYATIILFNTTWLTRLGDGPMWRRLVEPEQSYCRSNSWTNFLFVNNFVSPNEPCVQQAWFLAADFQLFMLGLIFLFAYFKFQQLRKALIVIFFTVPALLFAFITYDNNFYGVFIASPESQRTFFWHDEMYQKIHIATHANADCYLTGIISGLLLLQMKQRNINLMSFKVFRVIFYLAIPCGVVLLLSAKMFYANDIGPLLWVATYAALSKKLWGVIAMTIVFGCAHEKTNVITQLLSSRLLINLGKLTFVAFLTHINVMKVIFGRTRVPYDLSLFNILENALITATVTYSISFILYLSIEQPVAKIVRLFYAKLSQTDSSSLNDSAKSVGLSLHHQGTSLKA